MFSENINIFDSIPDTQCVPYSETACITAAQSSGYKVGNLENSGFEFAANRLTKGTF